jgi:hypothetical protein
MRAWYSRTIDMETGETVREAYHEWKGEWALAKPPSRSPVEGQVGAVAKQNQQQQGQDYGTAQGTLSQFEGPVQQSPFYKALLNTGTEATSNAYQNVMANTNARANAAGFGNQQPVTQGAQTQVAAQEAKDLAAQPNKALLEAEQPALAAAGQTASMGTALGNEAVGLSGQQVGLEEQYQNQQQQFGSGLFNSLLGVGMDAATGGLSGLGGNISGIFKNTPGGYQDPNSGPGYD